VRGSKEGGSWSFQGRADRRGSARGAVERVPCKYEEQIWMNPCIYLDIRLQVDSHWICANSPGVLLFWKARLTTVAPIEKVSDKMYSANYD
jgi:hypothetical protein